MRESVLAPTRASVLGPRRDSRASTVRENVHEMEAFVHRMRHSAIQAFAVQDIETARRMFSEEERVDALYEQIIKEIVAEGAASSLRISDNGAAAFEAIQSKDFDILLTDIMMPRMDGIRLTQAVKKFKPRLPVIVISAMRDLGAPLSALRAGAYCYVVKPVNIQELSLFIDRAIITNSLERELCEQNALLERRTEELRRSLNELREQPQLQGASRLAMVKKLSANVAHELKNPLIAINASFSYIRSRLSRTRMQQTPRSRSTAP